MTIRTEKGNGREALRRAVPLARFYDVGGRLLMLCSSGTGGPVVVFLPGAGMTGLGYLNLHEQASRFTTSVLYDRLALHHRQTIGRQAKRRRRAGLVDEGIVEGVGTVRASVRHP